MPYCHRWIGFSALKPQSFLSRFHVKTIDPVVLGLIVVCMVVGGIGRLASDVPQMLWISSATLAGVGVVGLLRLIGVAEFATPWSVLAVSYGLAYGLGSLNTFLSGYSTGLDFLSVTYAPRDSVVEATSLLLMLCGTLFFLGEQDSKKLVPSVELDDVSKQMVFWTLILTLLTAILAVLTGQLGFQSDMSGEDGSLRVSVLSNLVVSAMPPVAATALYCVKSLKPSTRWFAYLLVVGILLILVTQGRRILMYTMVIGMIGYFAGQGFRSLLRPKGLMVLIVGAFIVAIGAKFFFAMRQATYELPKGSSLSELIAVGASKMTGGDQGDLDEKLKENRSTRTFIIGYAAEILFALETHEPLGGDLMVLGVATAVPTTIWPGKWRIMAQGAEEAVCHPRLGMPPYDAANTLVTSGMCDFGGAGMFGYPVLFALMFSLSLFLVRRLDIVSRLVFGFGIVYSLLNAENVLTAFFVVIRNGAILALGMLVLRWLLVLASRGRKI